MRSLSAPDTPGTPSSSTSCTEAEARLLARLPPGLASKLTPVDPGIALDLNDAGLMHPAHSQPGGYGNARKKEGCVLWSSESMVMVLLLPS